MKDVTNFTAYCKKIGKDKNLSQAGGGNISIKINSNEMIIKKSGIKLETVSTSTGFVKVDFNFIANFIKNQAKRKNYATETHYAKILKQSILEKTTGHPSMETGFHSILGKAVIHSHPIAINSICCAKNAKKTLEKNLNDKNVIWIPYRSPGIELSAEIAKTIKNTENPIIILLENHGLIVSAPTLKECYYHTYRINNLAKNALRKKLKKIFLPTNIKIKKHKNKLEITGLKKFLKKKMFQNYLKKFFFPDAAIYLENHKQFHKKTLISVEKNGFIKIEEKNPKKNKKITEVLLANLCILMNITQYGKPKALTLKQVSVLKKMKLEKIRKEAN